MSFSSHKKSKLRLLLPVVLILLFLSLMPRAQKRMMWYEQMLANIVAPFQWVFSSAGDGFAGVWDGYISLVGTNRENKELTLENARLKGELARTEEVKSENERLRNLMSYRDVFGVETAVTRVIASDPRAEFKSVMIDKGGNDGIKLYMPVVGPKGLIGRIGRVTNSTAQVLLLNDPNSAVDAMVQRSRARGLLIGASARTKFKTGYFLTRLEYLRRVSDIHDNDVVVTSGLDGVFPPGLPVGTVHNITKSQDGIFKEAEVVPFENFQELQEVIVLLYN
jgi:rod shape-determining protein MreC